MNPIPVRVRPALRRARRLSRRGFVSLIGLLIVIVIIYYLVDTGYVRKNPQTGKSQAESYVDKGKDLACRQDRKVLADQLTNTMMNGDGSLPSPHILRAKLGSVYRCPGDGRYQIDDQGNVYCTEHSPAPESLEASVINLEE